MATSSFLSNGADTTNIAEADGGVTDPNPTFLTSNGGVRDTDSLSASTTLTPSEFIELEYSLTSTNNTAAGTTYCFRVTADGTPLASYSVYPRPAGHGGTHGYFNDVARGERLHNARQCYRRVRAHQ
jgi:hypothetical protein